MTGEFRRAIAGKVQTVLGPVAPDSLGPTLMHEHILIHMAHIACEPTDPKRRAAYHAPLCLETVSLIRFAGMSNLASCTLSDRDLAVAELGRFRAAGGRTVVDATNIGIGRDPAGLAAIARATGLNVVMGSSYYVAVTHPPEIGTASESDLAARIVAELVDGVDGTGIRPGLIGEVGCSWPLEPREIKVLRASARAQQATGAPLMIHPGRDARAPFAILDVLRDAGADLSRTVMCHIDRTLGDAAALRRLAATGCVIEFDLFGWEGSYYAWDLPVDMPNDAARINLLAGLVADGFGDRITVSHDICFQDKLTRWGGQGYAHILENVVPLMRRKGLPEAAIQAMTVDTPRRLLTFV